MHEVLRIRNLKVSNSRLTEGSYHTFTILKTIELGPDDSWYVMLDPLGYKVLMPMMYYTGYGFEPGQQILCRIDRINCNGRMFLEPMHPFYEEGKVYEFPLLKIGSRESITGDKESFALVKDVFDNEWEIRMFSENLIRTGSEKIKCRLERIKKGKLFLSLSCDKPSYGGIEAGKTYEFKIIDEKVHPGDRQRYFILNGHDGKKHLIRKKYFTHYGLKKGQTVRCMVDKFTSEGYFFLEPENPWYKIGEVYSFKTRELQKLIFSDGSVQDVLVLEDPHGDDIKVFIESHHVEPLKTRKEVLCRIDRIRKSRIEPEIII